MNSLLNRPSAGLRWSKAESPYETKIFLRPLIFSKHESLIKKMGWRIELIDIKKLTAMLLVFVLTGPVNAHAPDREIMLQIENDELVLRLAEVLLENRRLEKIVNEALSAQNSGQKVVSGCDPKELEQKAAIEWASIGHVMIADKSEKWIRENGPKCTVSQLKTISNEIKSLLYFPSTSEKMLKYMIKNRS
jgi:hypothetical protein